MRHKALICVLAALMMLVGCGKGEQPADSHTEDSTASQKPDLTPTPDVNKPNTGK